MTRRRLIWDWLELVLSNLIIQIIQITKDQIKSFKSTFGGNSDRPRHAMVEHSVEETHKRSVQAHKRTSTQANKHTRTETQKETLTQANKHTHTESQKETSTQAHTHRNTKGNKHTRTQAHKHKLTSTQTQCIPWKCLIGDKRSAVCIMQSVWAKCANCANRANYANRANCVRVFG